MLVNSSYASRFNYSLYDDCWTWTWREGSRLGVDTTGTYQCYMLSCTAVVAGDRASSTEWWERHDIQRVLFACGCVCGIFTYQGQIDGRERRCSEVFISLWWCTAQWGEVEQLLRVGQRSIIEGFFWHLSKNMGIRFKRPDPVTLFYNSPITEAHC